MRRAVLVVVAVAAGWVGCGDNRARDAVGEHSGERLRIVYFEYDGGTRQRQDALYDADRDERCTPLRWSDGLTYCTPEAAPALYIDRGCTSEVAPAGSPYALHQFWLTDRLFPSRLHVAGPPVATAPTEMYLARDGACLGPFAAPPGDYVTLGDAVAQDELARVHVGEPVGAGRIGLVVLTADDGLQLPARLYDRELDLECADDGAHCAPREAASADYFHDETCTTPELSLSIAAPPPTLAVHRDRDTACAAYYRVAGQTGSNPLYRQIADRCDLAEAPSGEHLFLLGDALALAPLRRTTGTGVRVQPIAVATGDITLAAPELFDATLGATCTTRDGRCTPAVTAPVLGVFADEICATGARVAEVAERACDPPTAFASDGTTLYPLVGASAPVYQLTTGDRCAVYLPPAGHALHALGPALALDQLAAAREVITSPSESSPPSP